MQRHTEKKAMRRWRQRLEGCCHKPRTTRMAGRGQRQERGQEEILPRVPGNDQSRRHSDFRLQTSGLQSCERSNFCS